MTESHQTDLADSLRSALSSALPGLERIDALKRLSGGASHETYSFDAIARGETIPLILRRSPGGHVHVASDETAASCDLPTEAALLRVVARAGAPVPEVVAELRPEHGLGPGFVMKRIEGETLAPRILHDEAFAQIRPELAAQCGRILARIHAAPLGELPGLPDWAPGELLRRHRDLYDRYDHPRPVFELAFRWLEARLPASSRRALVHGDFRNGNFIVGPEGVRAVLDWELSHIGDPMEDLGWICVNSWRFGRIDKPVGGFGERADFYAAYESAGGGAVDREAARFWEAFGVLKWGIACMTMREIFRSGRDRSMERAAIGRRASETEIDLLRIIEEEA